jgi:catechol 2,3-dioxygenase-like lactoylglutathione lyase family enzyme
MRRTEPNANGREIAMKISAEDERTASNPAVPTVRPSGLFEMTLEVSDLAASERFYCDVIGLPVVERWTDERPAVWLALGREGFLGLWPPETGGIRAIHGGRGGRHVHFALRVPMGTMDAVRMRLESLGYPVESWDFGAGNRAIYLDDPDGNVVELTERATLWDGSPATETDGSYPRKEA